MSDNDWITLAFASSNVLRLLSYAPQIWRVARDRGGAQAISCLTWNLWIAANASTALYAWTQLHDPMLTVMHIGNAVCCASVVLLTLAKRTAFSRAAAAHPPALKEPAMQMPPPPHRADPSLPRRCVHTMAVSLGVALLVGLLLLTQSACSDG
jgi:hypothetical protein